MQPWTKTSFDGFTYSNYCFNIYQIINTFVKINRKKAWVRGTLKPIWKSLNTLQKKLSLRLSIGLMRAHYGKQPPIIATTFSNSLSDHLWKFQLYYALPIRRKEPYIWYVSEQLLQKTMHSRTQQLTNKTHWFGVTLTNKGILTVTNESFLSSQPAQDVSGSNTYDLFGMNVTTLWSAVQFSTSFVRISLLFKT